MEYVVAPTSLGEVRGRIVDGVSEFKGVRYGAPTGGDNRFRPPCAPSPWSGTADALEFGHAAPQRVPGGGFRNPARPNVVAPGLVLTDEIRFLRGREPESEDCLSLNVWSQGVGSTRGRPVMVWLHGGGFNAGAGSSPLCDGANLVRRGDVVVVTLNHRLGALGFADLEGPLGADFAGSANVGMLDLVLALEWVRDNISAFGGDPHRVTIFGQSGGGWKVSTLLGMPRAHGLFHRAVIQSGPGVRMSERDAAGDLADRFLAQLGSVASAVRDPRRASTAQILRAQSAAELSLGPRLVPNILRGFVPVVDGATVPSHPFDPVASTGSAAVPILLGHTRTEMTLFLDAESLALDNSGLDSRVAALGPRAQQAVATYRDRHPDASPSRIFAYLHSDVVMLPFVQTLAERHAALGGGSTFYYRLDFETPVLEGRLMSPHGLDVPLVFANTAAGAAYTGAGPGTRRLSDLMSAAWLAFAETGNPNTEASGLPDWSPYSAETPIAMVFDETCHVEPDPQQAERRDAEAILEDLQRTTQTAGATT
jgi:para-nitrobenzyl esterase